MLCLSTVAQAPWNKFKGVDVNTDLSRVSILLFPSGGREKLEIECDHPGMMHLVYDTIKRMRELHAQVLIMSRSCVSWAGALFGDSQCLLVYCCSQSR